MQHTQPLVSVIIPTYKRADMLPRAIDSVLKQSYKNIEVIVVDDNDPGTGFRESTEKIMEEFAANDKVKYLKHACNKNGSAARNTGLHASEGKYVCFLDDDDFFKEKKTEMQVCFLENNPQYDGCFCDYEKNGQRVTVENKENYVDDILLLNNTPQTSGILFKRDTLDELNGFDETYIRHQDYELLLRFFSAGHTLGKVEGALYVRDISPNNNLPSGEKMEFVKNKYLKQFEYLIKSSIKSEVYIKNYMQLVKCYLKDKKAAKAFFFFRLMIKENPAIALKEIKRQISLHL